MNQTNLQTNSRRRAVVALNLISGLGVQRIQLFLQTFNEPEEIFRQPSARLEMVDGIGPKVAQAIRGFNEWGKVDQLIQQARQCGARPVIYLDDEYPALLREIYDPPMLLWVKGEIAALHKPALAVVGTRRATGYGLRMAKELSTKLSAHHLSITSGLAYGVDAVAHKAALDAGGKTVAVLGSGIDNIYPSKNKALAETIADKGGAVISEFMPGAAPDAGNFPMRNRIVSGLSLGTLVVESGLKGGSMITAQLALTQNREVFVVPHTLENVNGQGCNHLIKRAAGKLVQTVEDILEELPHYQQEDNKQAATEAPKSTWKELSLDTESQAICELLENGSLHIDAISEALDKKPQQLLGKLLELEMQACIRQTAGKNFELC